MGNNVNSKMLSCLMRKKRIKKGVRKPRKNVLFWEKAKKNKKNSKLLLTNRKVFDKIDFADARKVSKTKTKNLDN